MRRLIEVVKVEYDSIPPEQITQAVVEIIFRHQRVRARDPAELTVVPASTCRVDEDV